MKFFPVAASEEHARQQQQWERRWCPDENTKAEDSTELEDWSRDYYS